MSSPTILEFIQGKPLKKLRLIIPSRNDNRKIVIKSVMAHDIGDGLFVYRIPDKNHSLIRVIVDIDGYGRDCGAMGFPERRTMEYLLSSCRGLSRGKEAVIRELEEKMANGEFISQMDIVLSEKTFPEYTERLKAAREALDQKRARESQEKAEAQREKDASKARNELERITQKLRKGLVVDPPELKTLLVHYFPNEYAALKPMEKAQIGKIDIAVTRRDAFLAVSGMNKCKERPYGRLIIKLVQHLCCQEECAITP